MKIRRITPDDYPAIAAIQASSAEASQWSAADYQELVASSCTGWMADAETIELDKPAGFIIVRQAADEVEILNLAVEPPLRRQGIARILVAEVIQWGHNSGARSIWLEVRESNAGANRFYKAVGFCVAGRRRNYYGEPAEDALVLTAPIPDA